VITLEDFMSRSKEITVSEVLSILAVIVIFLLSLYFSLSSFTGYVVNQTINTNGNWISLVFFLIGLTFTYFLIWRRK